MKTLYLSLLILLQINASLFSTEDISLYEEKPTRARSSSHSSSSHTSSEVLIPNEEIFNILTPPEKMASFKQSLENKYDQMMIEAKELGENKKLTDVVLPASFSILPTITGAVLLYHNNVSFGLVAAGLSTVILNRSLQLAENVSKRKKAAVLRRFGHYDHFKENLLQAVADRYKNLLGSLRKESFDNFSTLLMQQMVYYVDTPSEAFLKQLASKFTYEEKYGKEWQDLLEFPKDLKNSEELDFEQCQKASQEWAVSFFMEGLIKKPFIETFTNKTRYFLNDPFSTIGSYLGSGKSLLKKYDNLITEGGEKIDPFKIMQGQSILYRNADGSWGKWDSQESFTGKISAEKKAKRFFPYLKNKSTQEKVLSLFDGYEIKKYSKNLKTTQDGELLPDENNTLDYDFMKSYQVERIKFSETPL